MLKNNFRFKNFLKSTINVCFLSVLAGFGGNLLGYNFLAVFLLFFAFQYILIFAISPIITTYFVETTRQKELDKLENLSTILSCAYCNQQNIVTFLPENNSRIEFECEHCKKNNLVTMQFLVARITESVNIPTVTGIPLRDI